MANICTMYDNYEMEHAEEFKRLIYNVINSALDITEKIDEDKLTSTFIHSPMREFVSFCIDESTSTIEVFVNYANGFNYAEEYDMTNLNVLNSFMKKYYGFIRCLPAFQLNLYTKFIALTFSYEIDAQSCQSNPYDIIYLLNRDLSVITGNELSAENWNIEREHHSFITNEHGTLTVLFPVDKK